jgi:hypothetical protein
MFLVLFLKRTHRTHNFASFSGVLKTRRTKDLWDGELAIAYLRNHSSDLDRISGVGLIVHSLVVGIGEPMGGRSTLDFCHVVLTPSLTTGV